MLKESIEQFVAPRYGKTARTPETYATVAQYCEQNLQRLIANYQRPNQNAQLLRETRNDIDYYLRRYQDYCIRQRDGMGSHYYEIDADSECDFEHLIPAARIRDLLIAGVITIKQAFNAPTVTLSRSKHRALEKAGWGSKTPNMWLPFQRYTQLFDAGFRTNDGAVIDVKTWTLEDHFRYFAHLTS